MNHKDFKETLSLSLVLALPRMHEALGSKPGTKGKKIQLEKAEDGYSGHGINLGFRITLGQIPKPAGESRQGYINP